MNWQDPAIAYVDCVKHGWQREIRVDGTDICLDCLLNAPINVQSTQKLKNILEK